MENRLVGLPLLIQSELEGNIEECDAKYLSSDKKWIFQSLRTIWRPWYISSNPNKSHVCKISTWEKNEQYFLVEENTLYHHPPQRKPSNRRDRSSASRIHKGIRNVWLQAKASIFLIHNSNLAERLRRRRLRLVFVQRQRLQPKPWRRQPTTKSSGNMIFSCVRLSKNQLRRLWVRTYLHRRRHPLLRHLKRRRQSVWYVISFSDWMSPSGCGSSSRPFLLAKKRTPLCTRSCSLHPRHNKRECVTKETDDEDEWFMFLSLNSVRRSTPQKGLEDRGSRKNGIHVMFVRSRLQPAHRRRVVPSGRSWSVMGPLHVEGHMRCARLHQDRMMASL